MSFKNLDAFKKRLEKNLITNAHKNAKSAVTRSTMLVEKTAQESIKNQGTGKLYQKYNPRVEHRASAPNQPPATDTGFLGQNITMNVKTQPNGSVVGQVISAAPYSKALEFGTVNMQPRPFMQPALNKNKSRIVKIFQQEGVIKK